MKEKDVIEFFDRLADSWDAGMIRDEKKIKYILDVAGVQEGNRVLDVACGTGVLIPDYLARKVKSVVAFDISPNMIAIAKKKFQEESKVIFQCTDVKGLQWEADFDCAVIYNAFPHFVEPAEIIEHLAKRIVSGGTLTVAHDRGIAQVNQHHSGAARNVSNGLISAEEMAELFRPYFRVTCQRSEEDIYVVSGVRK